MIYNEITGGVAAPQGFTAAGVYCGVKRAGYPTNTVTSAAIVANEILQLEHKPDLALISCSVPCSAAAVFTQNLVKGAPIVVCREHLAKSKISAVVANSGNANTCNADGVAKARAMCDITAKTLGIAPESVLVASTGVIGQIIPLEPFEQGIPAAAAKLGKDGTPAARAIMTTDTVDKQVTLEFELDGRTVRMGAMSKGSGMIHPNMATMLAFVTTDAAVSPAMLDKALRSAAGDSFNMLSVDGDTSTNDTLCVLASGLAGNSEITAEGASYDIFAGALKYICVALAKKMARDGEGATRLIECSLTGAKDDANARIAAKAVICSPLVKAAMFGCDANWGRVLCALGYSGADTDVEKIDVSFVSANGRVSVCEMGAGVPFSEEDAKKVLTADEVTIEVVMRDGTAAATAWGCDLTYDYVKINGDYRT